MQALTKASKIIYEANSSLPIKGLKELDVKVMSVLVEANIGMQEGAISRAIRARMNRQIILHSLARLQDHGYIVRYMIKNRVWYNITMQGRAVLDDLNARLIALTEAAMNGVRDQPVRPSLLPGKRYNQR